MKFITIRDLRSNTAAIRKDLASEREIVPTANGRPFAVMTRVEPETLMPFLEIAAAARAILVTGNLRHFPKKACKDVRVLSPAGLLDHLRRSV